MGKTGALTSKMSDGKRRNVIRKRKTVLGSVSAYFALTATTRKRERERVKHFLEKKKSFRKTFPPPSSDQMTKARQRKTFSPSWLTCISKGFFVAPLPPTVSGGEFYQRIWTDDGPAALVIPLSNAEYVRTCTCIKHIEKEKPKTFLSE